MTIDDESLPFDFDALLRDSAREALAHEDFGRFQAWLQAHLGFYWLHPEPPGPGLAAVLARSIWNAIPLPGNDMQPAPVAPPERNAPCPCGSGRKYKRCCRDAETNAPRLPPEMLYTYVGEQLDAATIERVIARPATPLTFALMLADAADESGRPLVAARRLEPLFAEGASLQRPELDMALSRLIDCYNALGYSGKKKRLMDRLEREAPPGPVRAEVFSRRAAMALERGERTEAEAWFRKAQRDAPDDPSHGPRELTMLLLQGELGQARERARFWCRRLERDGYDLSQPPFDFVVEAVRDPEGAMLDLADRTSRVASRPWRDWAVGVRSQAVEPPAIEPLADDETSGLAPEGMLSPAPMVARAEADWEALLDARMADVTYEDPSWWTGEAPGALIDWLQQHPAAANSFRVLDDLVAMAGHHPGADGAPSAVDALWRPLLERAHDLLAAVTRAHPDTMLPWAAPANRPALSCLVELAFLEQRTGGRERARDLFAWLLALNPYDNGGVRGELISLYLELGEDERALQLADAYADDVLALTRFGRVLALYRLDRRREARKAAHAAHAAMPLVRDYLVRKRVRQPHIDGFGFHVGGADQAWLHREMARPLWEATPGALAWLQRTLPSGQKGR